MRVCDKAERLSGANGLLLSPYVDKLFDRHWISFDFTGELIWRHEVAGEALRCWYIKGITRLKPFTKQQAKYIQLHSELLRT